MHGVDADADEGGARGRHRRGEEVSQHEVVVLSNLWEQWQELKFNCIFNTWLYRVGHPSPISVGLILDVRFTFHLTLHGLIGN